MLSAWLIPEKSQGSFSSGGQQLETQKLRHSDFGHLLEITSLQCVTFLKLEVLGRYTGIDKATLHAEIIPSHFSWSEDHYKC